jgi:transcriptional regulator with XRE-family HTH domain
VQVEALRAIVATNVRVFAEKKRIPLTILADLAGLSRSAVFVLLEGETGGSLRLVAALAEALGVEPWELLHPATTLGAKRPRRKRRARTKT